jgi:N-acetylmuramoyl-L-alanine amidase
MTIPGRLEVDAATGRLTGPAAITWNDPWPCANGQWGSGAMMGAVMHTMVSDLPQCVAWFNDPASQVSAHFGIAQDGGIHQFGPIGLGWIAWHAMAANVEWYGIEHADAGNPDNPLTSEQIAASAQIIECLSAFAGFPLEVSDSVTTQGYSAHFIGAVAWGGHSCPDVPPQHVRSHQRAAIVALAAQIRAGAATPPSWQSQAGAMLGQAASLLTEASSLRSQADAKGEQAAQAITSANALIRAHGG